MCRPVSNIVGGAGDCVAIATAFGNAGGEYMGGLLGSGVMAKFLKLHHCIAAFISGILRPCDGLYYPILLLICLAAIAFVDEFELTGSTCRRTRRRRHLAGALKKAFERRHRVDCALGDRRIVAGR